MKRILLSLIALMTMSSAFASVYWYLNEDFESGQIPASWTQEVVSANVANWVIEPTASATYPANGNGSAYYTALRNLTGQDKHYVTRLVSPAINFATAQDVYQPVLLLNHAQPGVGVDFDTLKVYYRVSAEAAWQPLKVFSSRIDYWQVDTIPLLGYNSASAYQLAFECVENMGRGIVLDDIRVRNTSTCVATTSLTVADRGATSVTLAWAGDLLADTFEVVVTELAVTDWSSYTPVFHGYATDFSMQVTGLTTNQTYFAYVRSICRDNEEGWTPWAMTTFQTRVKVDLPYEVDFTSSKPEGWETGTDMLSAKPTFTQGNTYSIDSTYTMAFSSISAGKYAYAATPEIGAPLQGAQLSFWATAVSYILSPSSRYTGTLYVGVMTDPSLVSTFQVVDSVTLTMANKHQWFTVGFDAYQGQGKYIGFMAQNDNLATTVYVDKVSIKTVASFVPTGLKVTTPTPDGFDVKLNLHGADSWNLRVAKAADYKHMNVLPTSFLLSQDGLTGSSYHVSASLPDSVVAVYVQGVKNGVASEWSFPVIVRIPKRVSLPLDYRFEASEGLVTVINLDKEIRSTSTAKAPAGVYFKPVDFGYYYPALSSATATPLYDSAHLILRGNDRWFTLPYIDSFAGQGLTFRLAAASAGQSRVAVGVMTDPYDLSTFTQLATFDGGDATYVKCEVDLAEYTGNGHYIAIRAIAPQSPVSSYGGSVNHIDELSVAPLAACREANGVQIMSGVQSTTITWNANGMNKWYVVVNSADTLAPYSNAQEVTTPSLTLTGLQSKTKYTFQIYTICGEDSVLNDQVFSFTTPYIMPLTENFDAISSGIPAGWDNVEGTTTSASNRWSYYSTGYEGHCLRFNSFYNTSGNTNYLATPGVFLSQDAMLKFMWKNPKGGDGKVLISIDGGNTRTVLLDSLVNVADWTEYEVDLTPYTGHMAIVYFFGESNYGNGDAYLYLDDVSIEAKPACVRPSSLSFSNITSSSAVASWTAGGNETQWQYLCLTVKDSVDWTQATLVNAPNVTLSGLSGATNYVFYVRSYCGNDGESAFIKGTFQTECGPIGIFPWSEDFEDYEGVSYNSTSGVMPVCWDSYSSGTVAPHVINSSSMYSYIHTGTKALTFYGSGYCTAVLPEFAPALNTLKISFWYRSESASNGSLKLGYLTANDSTFHEVFTYAANQTMQKYEAILTSLPTDAARLVFQWYYSDQWSCCIDDIEVKQLDLNCTGLATLRANATSPTQASVFWNVGGSQMVDIEVSDSANFADSTAYYGVSSNPLVLTDLTENTTYYVRARQSCDTVEGQWKTVSFKTLCAAADPDDLGMITFSEGASAIECWSVGYTDPGTTSSPTVPSVGSSTALGKYLYFSKSKTYISSYSGDTTRYADGLYAIMPELDIDSINAYEVSFTAFKTINEAADAGKLEVGVITDPADFSTFQVVKSLVLDYASDSTEAKYYTVSFKDYIGDYNEDFGKFIMFRAVAGDSANHVAVDNVEVSLAAGCQQVIDITVSDIQEHSVKLSWNDLNAEGYEVVILSMIGDPDEALEPVFSGTVTADSIVIDSLDAATRYYAYVRTNCETEDARWSPYTRFTTACGVVRLPYRENFNTLSAEVPVCWNNEEGTTSTVSYRWNYYAQGLTGACLRFNSYNNGDGKDNYLATPTIHLTEDALLTFMWKNPTGGRAEVLIAEEGDTVRTSLLATGLESVSAWTEKEIDLSAWTGKRVVIYFYSVSNCGYGDCYHYLDDVEVSAKVGCSPLGNITVSDPTRKGFTVALSAKGDRELGNCELVCSTTPLSVDGLDSVAKIQVDSTSIYTFTDLERETNYYVYARVNCGDSIGTSEWINTTARTKGLSVCDDIPVGTSASTNSYLPVYPYFDYSFSQQIYTPAEIGEARTFNYLQFYNSGTQRTLTINVYLFPTAKSEFSSTSDWATVPAGSLVFSGEVTFASGEWTQIDFTTPFAYDGTSNLMLVVDDNTGDYTEAMSCASFSANSYQSIYYYRDNTDIDPSALSSITGSRSYSKNHIRFGHCYLLDACPAVTGFSTELVGAGTSQAIVRWDKSIGDYLSSYDICLTDSIVPDSVAIVPTQTGVQADSVLLNGLSAEHTYYIYVRANCQADGHDDGSSVWVSTSFTTLANCPAVVGLQSELVAANAISASWGTAFADQALHFGYVLSTDTLTPAQLEAATPVSVSDTNAVLISNLLYDQTYFLYVASACGEQFSPFSLTTVKTESSCTPALDLTATPAHNRVRLNWSTTPFAQALRWEVGIVGDENHAVFVDTTTALLIGLAADSSYVAYVRAICSESDSSAIVTVPFTTASQPGNCGEVGDGSTTSRLVPFDNYYKNAWVQQIYPASIIGRSGQLLSIAFHCAVPGTKVLNDSIALYLAHTSMNSVSSTSDWIPQGDLVEMLVDANFVHPTDSGWITFNFTTPFDYNGMDNLAVVVSSRKSDYSGELYYGATTFSNYMTLYRQNDTYSSYAEYPAGETGTQSYMLADARFCFEEETCPAVINIQATDVTTTTANISWEPNGMETEWNVYLSTVEMDDMTGVTGTRVDYYQQALSGLTPDAEYWYYIQSPCGSSWRGVHFTTVATCSSPIELKTDSLTAHEAFVSWTDPYSVGLSYEVIYGPADTFDVADSTTYQRVIVNNTYATISGLEARSTYGFAVKAICADALESRYSEPAYFLTECAAVALPWTETFDGDVSCWLVGNVQDTSGYYNPRLNNSYVHGGTYSLMLNAYVYESYYNPESNDYADSAYAILPGFDYDTITLQGTTLSFYGRGYDYSSYYNHLLVGVTQGADISTFTLVQDVEVSKTAYEQYEVSFAGYQGTGDRIALIAIIDPTNYYSYYLYGRIYLDDMALKATPTCTKPKELAVEHVVADSATISWNGGSMSQWQYVCVPSGVTPDWTNATLVSQSQVILSGLASNSTYDFVVRAYCDSTEQSAEVTITFRSACDAVSMLPWNEGFEAYTGTTYNAAGEIPACWDVYATGSVAPHVIAKGGSYAYIHSGNNALTFYGSGSCYAVLPEFADALNTLQISFWYKSESMSNGQLTLGYITANDNNMSTFTEITAYSPDTAMKQYKQILSALPADAYRLAFKWYYSSQWSACIDDIVVDGFNANCAGVDSIRVSGVSLSGATIQWNYLDGTTNAELQVATDAAFFNIVDSAVVNADSVYYLMGLQASSTYHVRIRQLCSTTEASGWSTTSFNTGYGLPFAPKFTTSVPSDWMRSNTEAASVFGGAEMAPTTGGWAMIAADTVLNANHFRGNIFGTTWHNWVVTPAIDLTPNVGEGIMLFLDAGLTPYSSNNESNFLTGIDDRFLVAVSIDGGATWNPANVTEWNNAGNAQYVYNEVPRHAATYSINMSDYAGHVVKVGFYGESTISNADNYFHFGNIRMENVPSVTYVDTICAGESFNDHGFIVSYDQLETGLNAFSRYEMDADSAMVLTIQQIYVLAPATNDIYVTLCEGEHYNDNGFDFTATTSGTQRLRFAGGSVHGCDSTIYLHVTVIPAVRAEEHVGISEGESYTWNGHTYYQTTIAYDTTSSLVTGCDSITTLYLTVCPLVNLRYHAAFCQGGQYSDDFFTSLTAPGEYDATKTTTEGCEQHAHVILHQLAQGQDYVDTVLVADLPYILEGDTLCPATDKAGYVYHGGHDFGCGQVNVTIYVVDKTALANVNAQSLQIAPNPVAIGEDIHILSDVTWSADYTCRVFDAVGKLVYETFQPSYTIPGLYVAGMYTVRITSGNTLYQGKLMVK